MNHQRITAASADIAKYTKALAWLQGYGVNITSQKTDEIGVSVHPNYASSCGGSKEAAEVMSAYARINMPEIIKHSIECCKNTIEISKAAIREELDA